MDFIPSARIIDSSLPNHRVAVSYNFRLKLVVLVTYSTLQVALSLSLLPMNYKTNFFTHLSTLCPHHCLSPQHKHRQTHSTIKTFFLDQCIIIQDLILFHENFS